MARTAVANLRYADQSSETRCLPALLRSLGYLASGGCGFSTATGTRASAATLRLAEGRVSSTWYSIRMTNRLRDARGGRFHCGRKFRLQRSPHLVERDRSVGDGFVEACEKGADDLVA